MNSWRLLVNCADRQGLVHRVTGVLFRSGGNVMVNHEFADPETNCFFMRTEFVGDIDAQEIIAQVRRELPDDAEVRLLQPHKPRVVALVSKEHHCLADLLVRHAFGELSAIVSAVVSNHPVLGDFAGKFSVPFHCISHEGLDRAKHEAALLAAIEPYQPDYLVLAKYMRVLSPDFVRRYPGRIINIHHSFLPAFAGARPYHQAFQRGVKVIGATAHIVTDALDAGPIIVQEVIPVDHSHSPQELARAGRDVEQLALAKALHLVLEDRVFLNGNRTVIFD